MEETTLKKCFPCVVSVKPAWVPAAVNGDGRRGTGRVQKKTLQPGSQYPPV